MPLRPIFGRDHRYQGRGNTTVHRVKAALLSISSNWGISHSLLPFASHALEDVIPETNHLTMTAIQNARLRELLFRMGVVLTTDKYLHPDLSITEKALATFAAGGSNFAIDFRALAVT